MSEPRSVDLSRLALLLSQLDEAEADTGPAFPQWLERVELARLLVIAEARHVVALWQPPAEPG